MQHTPQFVKLLPWVGQNYQTSENVFRQRTLILGGSQYSAGQEEGSDFTSEAVEYYFDSSIQGDWKKTYSTFINSVFGRPTTRDERLRFFDSVVFYNYLQEIAGGAPTDAGNFDYGAPGNFNAFLEVLEEYRPEVVISWGEKVWNALPNDWGYGPAVVTEGIMIGPTMSDPAYVYPYRDATIRLVGVHHPSAGYGVEYHHELFRQLNLLA